jgi:hypothetical protein
MKQRKFKPSDGSLASLVPDIRKHFKKGRQLDDFDDTVNRFVLWCPFIQLPYAKLTNDMIRTEWDALSESAEKTLPDGEVISHVAYKPNTLSANYTILRQLIRLAVRKGFIPPDNDL